jgi:hypothetical membrane protein
MDTVVPLADFLYECPTRVNISRMLACGTILVGVFHECTEKFKLAAAVAILHVALAFPVLCGTFAAYR